MPHAVPVRHPKAAHIVNKRLARPRISHNTMRSLPDSDSSPTAFADRSAWIDSQQRRSKFRGQVGLHQPPAVLDQHATASASTPSVDVENAENRSISGHPMSSLTATSSFDNEVFSLVGSPYVLPSKTELPHCDMTMSIAEARRPVLSTSGCKAPLTRAALLHHTHDTYSTTRAQDTDREPDRCFVALQDLASTTPTTSRCSNASDFEQDHGGTGDSGRDADDEGGASSDYESLSICSDSQSVRDCVHANTSEGVPPTAPTSACAMNVTFDTFPTSTNDATVAMEGDGHGSTQGVPFSACSAAEYKKTASHLADWVAQYIWALSNTTPLDGRPLPRRGAANPPIYLAEAIKGCLLSTFLQPSAVFLSLWYLAQLPVLSVEMNYPPHSSEHHFRRVLYGEGVVASGSAEKASLELFAPFKLFVNGVLLASKLLDDNTFSNRTWHEVSRIQMRDINSLELYALDLLHYDLSVPHDAWHDWLSSLRVYHDSLAPRPAPIGPVRDTPHGAISHLLDELIAASAPCQPGAALQPIFLGIEQRIKQRQMTVAESPDDTCDTDDFDMLIREEYRFSYRQPGPDSREQAHIERHGTHELDAVLPPPANWAPASDPPINIDRKRPQYLAVQPPTSIELQSAMMLPPAFSHQFYQCNPQHWMYQDHPYSTHPHNPYANGHHSHSQAAYSRIGFVAPTFEHVLDGRPFRVPPGQIRPILGI